MPSLTLSLAMCASVSNFRKRYIIHIYAPTLTKQTTTGRKTSSLSHIFRSLCSSLSKHCRYTPTMTKSYSKEYCRIYHQTHTNPSANARDRIIAAICFTGPIPYSARIDYRNMFDGVCIRLFLMFTLTLTMSLPPLSFSLSHSPSRFLVRTVCPSVSD